MRHTNGQVVQAVPWNPGEDVKLLDLVRTHGKTWFSFTSKFPHRSVASMRNRYARLCDGSKLNSQVEGGISKHRRPKNLCKICGQIKLGHSCNVNVAALLGPDATRPGPSRRGAAAASPHWSSSSLSSSLASSLANTPSGSAASSPALPPSSAALLPSATPTTTPATTAKGVSFQLEPIYEAPSREPPKLAPRAAKSSSGISIAGLAAEAGLSLDPLAQPLSFLDAWPSETWESGSTAAAAACPNVPTLHSMDSAGLVIRSREMGEPPSLTKLGSLGSLLAGLTHPIQPEGPPPADAAETGGEVNCAQEAGVPPLFANLSFSVFDAPVA